jgi:hypothetical protein
MDYYYKYSKYKTKYLELKNQKGGKMEYGLYGLYSHYGNKLNLRTNNKRFNEINYVHDLPRNAKGDNIIIQHLKSHCKIVNGKIEYYPEIKSFEFVPYYESEESKESEKKKQDNKRIQELIDTTYFTKELNKDANGNVFWTELNKLKRFRNRGYSKEISEQIINSYAVKATELLGDEDNYKSHKENITELRRKALDLRAKRTCDKIHEHPDLIISTNSEKIPLEEIIKYKQLLLSSLLTGIKYKNNPIIYKDPYILVNEKLGILSWNLIINKATINCIMTHHDVLFPIRIILDMDPKILFFDNIKNNNKYENYMGFFLIRFENNSDDYTQHSKPHKSREQYYVFFVFKNVNEHIDFPLWTYTLTNFRNNIVSWGDVTEKKNILYYEILQLMCMYLKEEVYFYLVSSNNRIVNKSEKYNTIKSWIHSEDLKYINFDNEIHILVSKHKIDKVSTNIWEKDKYKYIDYDEYQLFECHFSWYDDDLSKDRFCIKLGNMTINKQNILERDACINEIDSELYKLDKLRYIQPIGVNNTITDDEKYNFDLNNPILELKLNEILTEILNKN